ncbi:hypothetical protein QUC31_009966 [Theobroma cacao]
MEERQLKGLCCNCDEPFIRGHQCKKLFWIDSVEEGDEDQTKYEPHANIDQPEISLNAIIGISTPQNMRLQGKLIGEKMRWIAGYGCKLVRELEVRVNARESHSS